MPNGKYFVIRSKLNQELCLDVKGECSDPGTKVVTYDYHGGSNQLWYHDHRTGTIKSKLNHMCLDLIDNRLVINHETQGDTNQQWEATGDTVSNRLDSNKVLDIVGGSSGSGAEVCSWDIHGGDNQKWFFEPEHPTYFYIVSKMSGKVLDIEGGDPSPGTTAMMWSKKEEPEDNQLWYEDMNGVITSKLNDLVLDGTDGLKMAHFDPSVHRQWWLIQQEKIVNRYNPNEVLDISGASHSDGADVIPFSFHGDDNQLWIFEKVE